MFNGINNMMFGMNVTMSGLQVSYLSNYYSSLINKKIKYNKKRMIVELPFSNVSVDKQIIIVLSKWIMLPSLFNN